MQLALQFRPFTRSDAEKMASWRYSPPYEIYNLPQPSSAAIIESLLQPTLQYFAVLNEHNEMIAFTCFGSEARVPGGDYSIDALDMGGGLRPDLTGQGIGRHVIAVAMDFAISKFLPRHFRTTVAAFNLRALRVSEYLGYRRTDEFKRRSDNLSFVILSRNAVPVDLQLPVGTGQAASHLAVSPVTSSLRARTPR